LVKSYVTASDERAVVGAGAPAGGYGAGSHRLAVYLNYPITKNLAPNGHGIKVVDVATIHIGLRDAEVVK